MKKDKHLGIWLLGVLALEVLLVDTFLKQVTTSVLSRSAFKDSYLQIFLAFDVGFGSCLLPVIGALKRGNQSVQKAARLLLLPPLLYICLRMFTQLPLCMNLLLES